MNFRSPCARSPRVDYAVHVRLPALLREHDPDVASRLEATSPHWGDSPPRLEVQQRIPRGVALALSAVIGRGAIWIESLRA